MLGIDELEDDTGTVFRDTITLALAGFVAMVVLVLPHLNPKAASPTVVTEPPGNLIVEARWPDTIDADVDLWVQAPGETPVGYSNKGGRTFNLLRDDRGFYGDPTELNYEMSFSRGLPKGEYIVNLHYYGVPNRAQVAPVPVIISVSSRSATTGLSTRLFNERITLDHLGAETTVVRFSVDEKGMVVDDSVNHIYKPLRASDGVARQ